MSDNQQTTPGSPVDSTTPAPDQSLSQVSSDNRPSSSVSADSPQISADLVQPSTDSSAPTDSSDNQPVTAISADSTQAPSESNRPDSIDSADSLQVPADSTSQPVLSDIPNLANDALTNQSPPPTPEPISTISADSSIPTIPMITPIEPVSSISSVTEESVPADLSAVVSAKTEEELKVDSPPAIVSPTEPPVEEVPPAPVPEETFTPDQTPISTSPITSPPDLSTPSDLNKPPPINVSSPDNQVLQVQSEPSGNTSTNQAEKIPSESAEIKPEPLESPTIPSTPPENISSSPSTVSFGDLLLGNDTPAPSPSISPSSDLSSLSNPSDLPSANSPPPVSPPQPSITNDQPKTVSFGNLLKDSLKVEPTINIEPIEPPIPSAPTAFPAANPPPITNNPFTSPKPDVSGEGGQPISSPSPISDVKDKLVLLRQQAKLKKAQKKQSTLQKIIDLAKTKGKINNQEAQKILHLPQSTLTDYFQELVSSGTFKKEGKGKATYYHL